MSLVPPASRLGTAARRPRRAAAAVLTVALAVGAALSGCSAGEEGSAPSASIADFPAATGLLAAEQARVVQERAAAGLRRQRTAAVSFVVERTDGAPLRQILNPTLRLDLRDEQRPVASLALSILASNVAVGGQVYRQQAAPDGASTVWVRDPEPKTPIEFVLWRPGSASRVAAMGNEPVAGQSARHFRVFDPAAYSGPTTPTSAPTRPGASVAIGEYDDYWFAEDGTLVRMVSVTGQLRLTSVRIEYGGDVRIDVPDTGRALTAEEYSRLPAASTSTGALPRS